MNIIQKFIPNHEEIQQSKTQFKQCIYCSEATKKRKHGVATCIKCQDKYN